MPELRLTARARTDLGALPPAIQAAVLEAIAVLGADPRAGGKPLVGRLRGLWSARVGNYRILYTIEDSSGSSRAIVRAIRHRATAYRPQSR